MKLRASQYPGLNQNKMLISFDCEFVDTGQTIELISIGMVRADGAELYLENACFPARAGHQIDDWMDKHVMSKTFLANSPSDPRIIPHSQIGPRVRDFVLQGGLQPSLWAHYASYDFTALGNLYHRMLQIPEGMPKFAMDFRVLQELSGIKPPSQDPCNAHHALVDARWGKLAFASFGIAFAPFDPERDMLLPPPMSDPQPEFQLGEMRLG